MNFGHVSGVIPVQFNYFYGEFLKTNQRMAKKNLTYH